MAVSFEALKDKLYGLGINVYSPHTFNFIRNKKLIFESPNDILPDVEIVDTHLIGAFNHLRMSRILNVSRIGRFCSIAKRAEIGPNEHAPANLSTHHLFQLCERWPQYPAAKEFHERNRDFGIARSHNAIFHDTREFKQVDIGNDVWLGDGVLIRRGVKIGDGAIVGARSLVTRDVEPYEIVAGIPTRHIRYRFPEAIRQRLLAIRWWDYGLRLIDGVDFADVERACDAMEEKLANNLVEPWRPTQVALYENYDIEVIQQEE